MIDMLDSKRAKHVVTDVLSKHFDPVRIIRVQLHEDIDGDGDPILRIDAVFDGVAEDLEGTKLSSIVRLLRLKLAAIGVTAFPLLSLISKADARDAKLAPA